MLKKMVVFVSVLSILVFVPSVGIAADGPSEICSKILAWGGPGGGGAVSGGQTGGSVSSGSQPGGSGMQTNLGLQVRETTENAGESQRLKARNEMEQNYGSGKSGGQAAGLLERAQQRLETMQREKKITGENWQGLKESLDQLKDQYKNQIANEVKNQIKSMFRQSYQHVKQLGYAGEMKKMLEDMISMDPAEPENYKELGALFLQEGKNDPRVFCDGRELKADVPPVIKEGRTLVPVRAITEAMGAMVQWNEAEQTVNISKGGTTIQLQVRNRIAMINGEQVDLDVPAEINQSRVYVPLRFISRVFNSDVNYYPDVQIITVNQ